VTVLCTLSEHDAMNTLQSNDAIPIVSDEYNEFELLEKSDILFERILQ
jgi:hypothetical protein